MTQGAVDTARFIETLEELLGRGHAVRFQADGWSMHPTIRFGEIIMIEPLGQVPVRAGNILLYRHSRGAIAHRVFRVASSTAGRRTLILRGDAADCCDSPIEVEQVLGRVIAVERRGRLLRFGHRGAFLRPILGRALRRFRVYRSRVLETVTNHVRITHR